MDEKPIGNDVNQVEPISLYHIHGQPQVIDVLKLEIKAYFKVRSATRRADHSFGPVALVGPSGTGKTMIAKAIHAELGNLRLFHTNGETINIRREFVSILINANEHTTVFIDEAQGMNTKTQNLLLTVISERFLPMSRGSARMRGIILKNFTLILATTHEYLLQSALRNRMRIYCRFRSYSIRDLASIVQQRIKTLTWAYESQEVVLAIARRAKGIARNALNRNLQMCWQVSQICGHDCITMGDVNEAFSLIQVDELGLDETDRQYLGILAEVTL